MEDGAEFPIGSFLRARRLAGGLHQKEVAARAGISASYLALIESGRRIPEAQLRLRIAHVLGISDGEASGQGLAQTVRMLSQVPGGDDAGRMEGAAEFAARFPAWAALLLQVTAAMREAQAGLRAMSDPLRHEERLASGLHEVLSAAAAISSAAAILDDDGIDANWRRRFVRNIGEDADRLLGAVGGLSEWLDKGTPTRSGERPEDWLARHPDLPEVLRTGWSAALAADPPKDEDAARTLSGHLARFHSDAERLPEFPREDPLDAAADFGLDPTVALRRAAVLGRGGLVVADASGLPTLLLHLPPEFPVPLAGDACSLWPLHHASPGRPSRAVCELEGASGTRLRCTAAVAERQSGGVPVSERVMLVEPAGSDEAAERVIGPGCRSCALAGCPARRAGAGPAPH